MTDNTATSRPGVVIAGGGVAALECLMALRDLAGPDLPICLVAPDDAFRYRAMEVAEPFSLGHVESYALRELAADFGAELVSAAVVKVRPDEHLVLCRDGTELDYEAFVLATGARPVAAFPRSVMLDPENRHEAMHGLLADLEQGYGKRVAFVVPRGVTWTLPLYELAIMTAREVRDQGFDDVRFTLVTPEARPLALFGPAAGATVGELMDAAGVGFAGSTYAVPDGGALRLEPGGGRLEVDRVVALPTQRGPAMPGLPADALGFVPADQYGRVAGLDDVFAAGDVTTFPIKQGGLAAQQADVVAGTVAAHFGGSRAPRPFKPVLRGLLFTGGDERFLRAGIGGGDGDGVASTSSLWWPPTKVAGQYLAPYLFARDEPAADERPPAGFTEVALPVGR